MGIQSLGIDIGDSHITGVVLELHGRLLTITAMRIESGLGIEPRDEQLTMRSCSSIPTDDRVDPSEAINILCQQFDWKGGVCVCGLSLSQLSVRNLRLPFLDGKKIAQVIPYELEEQLLAPVETLVSDFSFTGKSEGGSSIVSFSLEKSWLSTLFAGLHDMAKPDMVTPAMASLAMHLVKQDKNRRNFLLVHVDLYDGSLALVVDGQPEFFRRLANPGEMILRQPFRYQHGHVEIVDPEMARQCIHSFCSSIERSLEYFRIERKERGAMVNGGPELVVLTGPLAHGPFVAEIVEADLGLPVEYVDFFAGNGLVCPEEVREQWLAPSCDLALALALQGFRRTGINLLQEEFAPKRTFFSSPKRLMAVMAAGMTLVLGLLGFFGYNYYHLQERDAALHETMNALYKQTFPDATKVQDPLTEMQVRMKSMQGVMSPALFLHDEKRVLSLLADISARIPRTVALRVNRLSIDRDTVSLKGTTDTFNAVQTIRSALTASPKFKSVQIVSAIADKEQKKGAVRFEVQLQVKEP
jgi:Type II secretory pathway, component PulL